MAASITLSAASIAADGKTLTATVNGGTAPYMLGGATGIVPHLNVGSNAFGLGVTSASVSGSTLTVNMTTPAGSGETFQLDFPSSVTLTDSASNTPTGQSNLAVTNNSAVTVLTVPWFTNAGVFEHHVMGPVAGSGINTVVHTTSYGLLPQPGIDEHMVEFTANCTEVALLGYSGTTTTYYVDGATAPTTALNNGFWSAKPLTPTPLPAGNHLFLVSYGDNFQGVRISGGTRTMTSVATTKQSILPNTNGQPGIPATTNIATWGAWKAGTVNRGDLTVGQSYEGTRFEFGINATGVEVNTTRGTNSAYAVSVDAGQPGPLVPAGVAAVNNNYGYVPLAVGLTPGSHTIQSNFVSSGIGTSWALMRAINGTALTTASAVNDTTLTVASTTYLAVGDWLRIDKWAQREWRQITAISGSGPYTLTLNAALAKTHAVGIPVTSYSAPAGSFYSWTYQDESVKKVVGMGDSNTQGANDYGGASTPDANGNYYALYDPRCPPLFLAASKALRMEVCNIGIQGQGTGQMAARAADINTFSRGSYDYVVIWPGTNDINNTSSTYSAANLQSDVQTMVNACTGLRAGGKIILMPPGTPVNVTNAGGLNLSTAATALQNVAAANPSTCVYAANVLNGVLSAEISGVHYHVSGQAKIANNLLAYLGGAGVGLLTTGFFGS